MLMEMHCHTAEHSACSKVPAVELVQRVLAKRLHGLVLTDHHFLWSEAEIEELRRQSGVPSDFIILSGQETNVPILGDLLIYGAPVTIPRGTPLEQIRKDFPGAAIVWAHPYRDGRVPGDELLSSPLLNGVEIFNSNHTVQENSRGLQDWRRLQFTATGGTDTHAASYAGVYPTVFDQPLRTVDELVSAIRTGQCRPYFKATAHREASKVIEVTIGKEKPDHTRETVIIRTSPSDAAWSAAEKAFQVMAAISRSGFAQGTFRVPEPIEKNADSGTIVELAISGVSLFDKLVSSSKDEAQNYLRLAARWLARLHHLRLRVTTPEEFLREETRRLDVDLAGFAERNHPYLNKITGIIMAVQTAEHEVVHRDYDLCVQGHGDYHPKNLIVGQDGAGEEDGIYLAAIDFERSQVLPPAFDVGWFLAQARSQFATYPGLSSGFVEEVFLEAYKEAAGTLLVEDFWRQVELFRARANISIAAFLVKMGLEDAELWRVLVESERALTYVV